MRKKELIARGLQRSGALTVVRRMSPGRTFELRILAYHRVYDIVDESDFPFDPELVSASTRGFRAQMECVAKHFRPVTFDEVIKALDRDRPLPRRAVAITFDDGHADNYTHAFPILRDVGVSAMMFLSTGYIGKSGTFWFDHVANLLFRAPSGTLSLKGMRGPLVLGNMASRRRATEDVLEFLKQVPDVERREAIARLEDDFGVGGTDSRPPLGGAMTWPQVQEMSVAGIEFGSHTVSHPVLSRLDPMVLDREMTDSRLAIQQATGQRADVIAYPVGGREAFDGRVVSAAQRAGYRLGLSYISGSNDLRCMDRFALKRLHVERYTSPEWFQSMLEFPRLFS